MVILINRIILSLFCFPIGLALLSSCNSGTSNSEKKPNIIFIMADDLGYHESGCYGQEIIRTPNIDRLAGEGIRFTQFYSGSPVCAPSRCVMLTGLHTGHAYVRDNYEMGGFRDEEEGGQLPLPAGTMTLGRFMKEQGYVTGAIGKWGLGGPGSTGVPEKQGFDYFYGYLCQKQAHNYYPTHLWENGKWDTLSNTFFMPHQKLEGDSGDPASYMKYKGNDYSPAKMMEKALAFLEKYKDTSFFLYLPFTIPHLALQVPDEYLEGYTSLIPDTPYTGNKSYLPHPSPRAAYAAMVTYMDSEIGRIMEKLAAYGIDGNTAVFFTSDNGATYNRIGGSDSEFFRSNDPFREYKGNLHEGGIRVPFIARWPGHFRAGETSGHIAAFQDVFPTLAALSGAKAPEKHDGISFLPELTGIGMQEEHPYLYWEFPSYGGQVAVRYGDWKMITKGLKIKSESYPEIYNLKEDPGETNNLVARHPELVNVFDSLILVSRRPSEEFPFPALDSLSRNSSH